MNDAPSGVSGGEVAVAGRTRDAERTKGAILAAARRLFAEQDFSAVSIRDVAAAAGVSHGLVQHHFGTRSDLVAAIIGQEVAAFAADPWTPAPIAAGADRERLREELKARTASFTDFARLITRAELDGAEPEKFLDPDVPTPAQLLAEAIRGQQQRPHPGTLDPAMVAAYINAATFAFATLAPWLMTAVGLEPSDYETRLDEIVDISMLLIAMSASE